MGIFGKSKKEKLDEQFWFHISGYTNELESLYIDLINKASVRKNDESVHVNPMAIYKLRLYTGAVLLLGYSQRLREIEKNNFKVELELTTYKFIRSTYENCSVMKGFDLKSLGSFKADTFTSKIWKHLVNDIENGPSDLANRTEDFKPLCDEYWDIFRMSLGDAIEDPEINMQVQITADAFVFNNLKNVGLLLN